MTPPRAPLLDTSLVLHSCRDTALFKQADRDFWLTSRPDAPMISVVTIGEMLAIALKNNWGPQKSEQLRDRLAQLSVVGIDAHDVLERYAVLDAFCAQHGKSPGKNDLWIAACASCLDAVLLSTDKDFLDLPDSMLKLRWYDPDATY